MSAKVYVGNLPFKFSNKDLTELFSAYGEVTEAVIITDKYSGRSKGFGFVTFADEASAEKAISEMDGKDVDGRQLKVSIAKALEPRERTERRERRY